jgi:Ca2+-transporting ATPase
MAGKGMRVLALAIRLCAPAEAKEIEDAADPAAAENKLCFLGLAAILDPPRAAVPAAIASCHRAGIRVCMITGDHAATARAIARSIGIIDDKNDNVVNGDTLSTLSEEQLGAMDPFPCVFSRVSPDNKLKIVKALRAKGEVVAMTGDGVNDAPAIKQADVGVAMGINGTEITRQAADIVLADDNFATIVSAVEEGRRIFDNIVKFVVYLLSCNSAEVLFMLLAVAADWPVPLKPMMILWANIFADVPPSLSLGIEPPEDNVMTRQPREPSQGVFSPVVAALIVWNGGIMTAITMVCFWYAWEVRGESEEYTRSFGFVCLTTLQLLYSFSARSLSESIAHRNFLSNPWNLGGFIVAYFFIMLGVYAPGLNDALELEGIRGPEWLIIFIAVCVHTFLIEAQKFIIRRYFSHHL